MIQSLSLLALSLVFLASCAKGPSEDVIDLSALEPLPYDQPREIIPLRIAIANVISPSGNLDSYSPLLDYLSQKLNRPVELVQGRTYAETNDMVQRGEVDVAVVCSSAYVTGHDEFGMQLLVAPRVDGKTVYFSELIVPAESDARSMADLEGAIFAFTDPMSNSGRLYPASLVYELGKTPESFFSRTFFTYSHDDAILAVSEGLADGAAVDSLVLDLTLRQDPALRGRLRIIHRSPPFGIPPIVVGPELRPQLRAELLDLFSTMDQDPAGREVLAALHIDEFTVIQDSAYDSVRELAFRVLPRIMENP